MKKTCYIFLLFSFCSLAQHNTFPSDSVAAIVKRITLPQFPAYKIKVTQLGAKGDSVSNDKPAFDKAMALCKNKKERKGNDEVVF